MISRVKFTFKAGAGLDRRGATAIEYGLILLGIAVTIAAAIPPIGQGLLAIFTAVTGDLL